jgi:hypothetical protein
LRTAVSLKNRFVSFLIFLTFYQILQWN